jgi:hypothetical protein
MSARETGAVEPTETGIDAGIEAILAKDDTAIMLDELREILGADIDVDSRFTIAQMLTVMERCFKDGEAWNRMIERAKAAALSRPQPTPAGEIVERFRAWHLYRTSRSNRRVETPSDEEFDQLIAAFEQQAATIAELREHLREAEHYVRAWTQEHGETGTLAQARGNALLDNIRATLERTRGQ